MGDHMFFAGKTVLLVEDELFTAERLRKQLNALGYGRVLVATDLATAQSLVDETCPEMALLDVNVQGGETTIEFGRDLAADGVPVVFFSGFNAEAMMLATRGHEFMEKPVSLPRLKAAILRAILRSAPPAGVLAGKKNGGPGGPPVE